MGRFIVFLDRIVNLYLYFVIMACFLALVPNINPDYPLFHYIFTFSGFYLIPPVFGISFSPACVMVVLALMSAGLRKIYNKYFEKEKHEVIIMSPEEFLRNISVNADRFERQQEKQESSEEREDDSNG